MFLQLNHQKLEIYSASRTLITECYKLIRHFPSEEKFNLVQQIRRAAVSVHLNVSEGCSRKSEVERKRFYEIARGSLIEIDAALDAASDLNYFHKEEHALLGSSIVQCFKLLSGMMTNKA
jgi:four helix bundle protein